MKKILLSISLLTVLTAKPINIDSLKYVTKSDTSFVLPRPDTNDSLTVVKIVDGVVNVSSIFVKEPILNTILKSPYTSGGLVAIILGVWRRIEKRRLRKKGKLKD